MQRSCRWVFYLVWSPFTWLVGYVDPRKPSNDVLHGELAFSNSVAQECICDS